MATPTTTWRSRPLLTKTARAGETVDLRALNAQAASWCTEANAAVHAEICAIPGQRLGEERRVLKVLPSLRSAIEAGSARRKVDSLSCIRYGSTRYSVPKRLVGTTVAVVVDHSALILLEPATRMIVAEHELSARPRPRFSMNTTTGPDPHPHAGRRRKPKRRSSSCFERRSSAIPRRSRRDRQHPTEIRDRHPARTRRRPR